MAAVRWHHDLAAGHRRTVAARDPSRKIWPGVAPTGGSRPSLIIPLPIMMTSSTSTSRTGEVIVCAQGASDYDEYFIHAYDGHVPKRLGELRDVVIHTGNGLLLNVGRMRGGKEVVTSLKAGSRAHILAREVRACGADVDSCLRYLIRSESGLPGWRQGIDTDGFTDLLPAA